MTKHEQFLQELRAPFMKSARAAGRKSPNTREKKNRPADTGWEADDDLMKDLEAKFNEIFGIADDE